MLTTTLENIRIQNPCYTGYKKLLRTLEKTGADNTPVSFLEILDSNGLDDAIWCLRAEPYTVKVQTKARQFAIFCARQLEHFLVDERSKRAIEVAESFIRGEVTKVELNTAWKEACAAINEVEKAATKAVWEVEKATANAVWEATRTARSDAVAKRDKLYATRGATWTAKETVWPVAWAAAQAASTKARIAKGVVKADIEAAQVQEFIRLFGE